MADPLRLHFEPANDPMQVKVVTNRDLGTGRHATSAESADNPLAAAILSVDGVAEVYILGNYVTVTRKPDADWRAIGPMLQVKLHEVLG